MIHTKIFISGHRNITEEEFNTNYIHLIHTYLKWAITSSPLGYKHLTFYIGDCIGCDTMAINYIINYINKNNLDNVDIKLCMLTESFEGQNNTTYDNKFIEVVKQFNTHEERDCYMTENTSYDILWVREGEWASGTAQNFVRRHFHSKLIVNN